MPHPSPDLSALSPRDLQAHLLAGSGLPGPRANLALVDRCAAELDQPTLRHLSDDEDEYLAMCGTAGLARAIAGTEVGSVAFASLQDLLTARASDDRWRVREAVARGLQLAADVVAEDIAPDSGTDVALTHATTSASALPADAVSEAASPVGSVLHTWLLSGDPRLMRATLATICEPRLLRAPEAADTARDACVRATTLFAGADAATRRTEAWVSLRKTLEYAWSVAVAADPAGGLPVFRRLAEDPSPVVRSIVAKNLTRARLARLIEAEPGQSPA